MGSWEPIELDNEEMEHNDHETGNTQRNKYYPYIEQAKRMARIELGVSVNDEEDEDDDSQDDNDADNHHSQSQNAGKSSGFGTTLFADFHHIYTYHTDLAEAIESEYIRFEPYLRQALQTFMYDLHPELSSIHGSSTSNSNGVGGGENNGEGGTTDATTSLKNKYFIAMHNLPSLLPLRSLRTDTIGKLTSVSGTVTRTSDVRPELLIGNFRCDKCGLMAENIIQQFHYTRPVLCRNPRCGNRREFLLDLPSSTFCDWQKLRVQENSSDVPPGCMPRSMDMIVRNDMVERCKAGDSVVFVGSLVVIPDGSALARVGEAPQSSREMRRNIDEASSGGGGGVRGLKSLGVRELTYKTCFMATSVLPVDALARYRNNSVKHSAGAIANFLYGGGACNSVGEDDLKTMEEVATEMSEEEKEDIRMMRRTPNLYSKVRKKGYMTIYDHSFLIYHADVDKIVRQDGGVYRSNYLWAFGGEERNSSSITRWSAQNYVRGDPSSW